MERVLRPLAWVIAAVAMIGPSTWAWWMIQGDLEAQRAAGHRFFCGNGVFAYIVLGGIAAALLSLVAVVVGGLAYRALPEPRPVRRAWELALLTVPLVCVVVVIGLLFVSIGWN